MLTLSLFVIINLISESLQTCVTIEDQDHIYPTVGEIYRWPYRRFIRGDNLTYGFNATSAFFTTLDPLNQLGESAFDLGGKEIIAKRAYDAPETGVWKNHFAFLAYDSTKYSWFIYYAEGNPTQMYFAPNFQNNIEFITNKFQIQCYDFDYIDENTFVVDCGQKGTDSETPMTNYVYIVKKGEEAPSSIQTNNWAGQQTYSYREIQYHVYDTQNIGDSAQEPQRILLRGYYAYSTPGHNTDNLDTSCWIEVLAYNATDNQFHDTNHFFNKGNLINDLKLEDVNFTLIDFKIMPNGDIYILDAYNGIFVYYINDKSNWQFKRQIQTYAEMAMAFDVNNKIDSNGISHIHIVVQYKSTLVEYIDSVQTRGWLNVFNTLTHPSYIYASQQYIFAISQQQYYLFDSDHDHLITHRTVLGDYLINPYEPDAISISTGIARRFEIGNFKFQFYSDIETKALSTLGFWGQDASGNICYASIKFQVLIYGDTNLYSVDHDPFPEIVTYPADAFFLQEMAAGPNLIYNNGNNSKADHAIVSVHTIWELNVTGIDWPLVTDVAYADVLVDPHWTDSNKFYFLYQHANKTVVIYECLAESITSPNVDCELHDTFTLPNKLDRSVSQFDWYATGDDTLTIQFIEHDYQITFYESSHTGVDILFELKYTQSTENKITSFTILKQGIYVVLENKQQVDVYFTLFPTPVSIPITSATMQSQGSSGTFKPRKIFGNPYIKSEFILILSETSIYFGDMRNTFTLIYQFPILNNAEVDAYIGDKTVLIVQRTNTESLIQEYNIESLSHIYLQKKLPLYRYTIQTPLTTDYCYETGFLFVRALDKTTDKTVILVYEQNVLAQLSLHKVVETHLFIANSVGMNMAAAGRDQMFMYVNNQENVQKMVGFLRDAIMTITPNHISNNYVTTLSATVNITNQEVTTPMSITYPVKFINTQTYIQIDQESLNKQNSSFVFINQKADQYVDIPTSTWQMGQVVKYEIECNSCQSHLIEVVNPVYHITDGSELEQLAIIDGAPFSSSMVYMTQNTLIFTDSTGARTGTYQLPLPQYGYCDVLTVSEDGKYVFTGCQFQSTYAVYLSFCTTTDCVQASPQYQVISNGIQNFGKLYYKDTVLYILDANTNRPSIYDGNVRVHKVTIDDSKKTWDLDAGTIINSKYLSTESNYPLKAADFDVIKFFVGNVYHYKIVITTTQYRLWFVHMYIDGNSLKFVQHDKFELYEFIYKQQVIQSNTLFLSTKAYVSTVKDSSLYSTILITSNNLATYGVTFTFDVSSPTTKGSPVSTTASLPFLLTNYGTWTTINKLSLYDNHAVIAYTDQSNILAAVYKLPTITHNALQEDTTQIITFIGGEKDQQYSGISTSFVLVLSHDPNQTTPVLYTNLVFSTHRQNNMLIKYGIHDTPRLFVQNGDKIAEQNVYITAKNDYNSARGVIKLTKTDGPGPGPNPDPDDDNSGGSKWWWITLIVIFGVALIGVGGYFFYTKVYLKKKRPLHIQSY